LALATLICPSNREGVMPRHFIEARQSDNRQAGKSVFPQGFDLNRSFSNCFAGKHDDSRRNYHSFLANHYNLLPKDSNPQPEVNHPFAKDSYLLPEDCYSTPEHNHLLVGNSYFLPEHSYLFPKRQSSHAKR
jgi:hypothetical protein